MKNPYRKMLAVFMAVAAMAAAYLKMGIFFETNDDRIITEMLSGGLIGTPDAHVQLVNYLLTAPIAGLYKVAGGIPWYGGCLILFHTISYYVIFQSILSKLERRFEAAVGVVLCCSVFLINLYLVGFIQWTSTAALLAIAGYVCLILKLDGKAVLVYTGLELLAYLLRSDAMLMIQPLGGVLFGILLSNGKWKENRYQKIILEWVLATAGVLLIGSLGNWMTYRSDEWKDSIMYSKYRAELIDYHRVPSYEEVQNILDKYHVSQIEYEGMANNVTVGSYISADCLEEVRAYTKSRSTTEVNWLAVLRESVEQLMRNDSLSCNRLAGILWLCMLLWLVFSKSGSLIVPVLGLGAARTMVWCFLIYRGRMPDRVTYPLLFAEIIFLLVLMLKSYAEMNTKTNIQRVLAICICFVVVWNAYGIGQRQYRFVNMVNEGQAVYMQGYKEIKDYCSRHLESRYVLDSYSFSFYKGSALETDFCKPLNGIYAGGWNGHFPTIKAYEEEYLSENWKDFYVIVYDDGQPQEVQETSVAVRYFTEKTGITPTVSDQITVSHGGSYLIWHFGG